MTFRFLRRVKSHRIVRGESFACYGTCRFYDTIYDRSPDYFVYNHLTLRKFFYDIIYDNIYDIFAIF